MTHTKTKVTSLPDCDICKLGVQHGKRPANNVFKAAYDGRTKLGPWAYMCDYHFKVNGVGLGLGKGQKLVLEERLHGTSNKTATEAIDDLHLDAEAARSALKDVLGDDEDAIQAEMEDFGYA